MQQGMRMHSLTASAKSQSFLFLSQFWFLHLLGAVNTQSFVWSFYFYFLCAMYKIFIDSKPVPLNTLLNRALYFLLVVV